MKKVLFVSSTYLPQPNAVGVCVEAVANEFKNCGYEVHVVTLSEGPEYDYIGGVHVYNVHREEKQNKIVPLRKISTGFNILLNYPLENLEYRKKLLNKISVLLCDNDFEMVICAQKPATVAWIGMEIKNQFTNQRVVLYELDSITDNNSNYSGYTKFLKYRNFKLEKNVYNKMDLIIHLDSHREFYEHKRYNQYNDKSIYVGIPLIDKRLYCTQESGNQGKKVCVYAGMLYSSIRTPYYLIDLIEALQMCIDVQFDFFTHGEFDEFLKQKEKELHRRIVFNGYIDKSEIDNKIMQADYLLNIGNCYPQKTGAVPSKLFAYISSGKPIIHISPNEFDTSLPYLEKCDNALIIKQEDSFEFNVQKLKKYLEDNNIRRQKWNEIENNYIQNTPIYTVDKIIEGMRR